MGTRTLGRCGALQAFDPVTSHDMPTTSMTKPAFELVYAIAEIPWNVDEDSGVQVSPAHFKDHGKEGGAVAGALLRCGRFRWRHPTDCHFRGTF